MTPISTLEQSVLDLDWFACDEKEQIAHFTTAGVGYLPTTVATSQEQLRELTRYFRSLPRTRGPVTMNSDLLELARIEPHQLQRYIEDFDAMAHRGLFSFDHRAEQSKRGSYFRVTAPRQPILLSDILPSIQDTLRLICIRGTLLEKCEEITKEELIASLGE